MSWLGLFRRPDRIDGDAAREHLAEGALLVDVRTRAEFAAGHLEGARNMPLSELPRRLDELGAEQVVVVYCRSGARSARATRLLRARRTAPVYDLGSFARW